MQPRAGTDQFVMTRPNPVRRDKSRPAIPPDPLAVGARFMSNTRAGFSYRRNQTAEQRSPIIEFPRGKYIGRPMGDPPKDEAEGLYRCPACGGWVDCRDLGQVFDHEGPLPSGPKIGANKI
jgi:hypothetical protein